MTPIKIEYPSDNLQRYEAGAYAIVAAGYKNNWGNEAENSRHFEISIYNRVTGETTLLRSNKFNFQSVQEVANAIGMLLSDSTQNYTAEWCKRFLT